MNLNSTKIMKYLLSFLFLAVCFFGCKNAATSDANPPTLVIQHVNTIDPIDGLKPNQTVLIANDRIIEIKDGSDENYSSSTTVIDGTGKYVIPGLWDAHVHFAYMEDLAPSMFNLFLGYGITSVRDTGGKIDFVKKWKKKAQADPSNAPRVKIAGPLLDGIPNVYDGSTPSRPPLSVGLGSVAAVEKMVDQLVDEDQVDLLKAYEMLTPEQFVRVMELAKEKGLKVTGHVPLSMDVISASNAGLNSMEHLRNLELSCASNAEELLTNRKKMLAAGVDDEGGVLRSRIHQAQRMEAVQNHDETKTKEVLAVLAKNQTWQIPTLTLMNNLSQQLFKGTEWQNSFNYLPDTIAKNWRSETKNLGEQEVPVSSKTYANFILELTGKVHKAGIGIMAGTDCPIFFLTPGLSLHVELEMLVASGLSPLEALQAATLKPAQYFGLEDLGRIQANGIADLVLLDANPLEDIRNTKKIQAVVKNGKAHLRTDLDQLLSAASVAKE